MKPSGVPLSALSLSVTVYRMDPGDAYRTESSRSISIRSPSFTDVGASVILATGGLSSSMRRKSIEPMTTLLCVAVSGSSSGSM